MSPPLNGGVSPTILPVPISAVAGFFVFPHQSVVVGALQPSLLIGSCAASLAIGAGIGWWIQRRRPVPLPLAPAPAAPRPPDSLGPLITQLPFPAWILDRNGGITEMSGAACETLGFGSNFAGRTFEVWGQPAEIQSNWHDAVQRALGGAPVKGPCSFVLDGVVRYGFRILVPLRGTGPARAVLGLLLDLPVEKKLPAPTAEFDGRLAQFFRVSPIPVIECEAGGAIRTWNPAAELLFGYSGDEVLGRKASDFLILEGQRSRYSNAWAAVADQRRTVNLVLQSRTKAGGILSCEWSSFPVFDSQQRVSAVLSFVKDVTEAPVQVHVPAQGSELNSLARFATDVAQEFDLHLTPMALALDRLAQDASEPERILEHVSALRIALDHTKELIDRTQLIGRELPNTREWTDLNDVVKTSLANLRSELDARIILNTTLAPSLPQLPISRAGVMQMITQLVFQSRDSLVGISVGSRSPLGQAAITVTTSRFEGINPTAPQGGITAYQVIAVRDNGPGLNEEARIHAFDPALGLHSPGSRRGLALHLIWRVAHQHGGWVSLHSAPGQGCEIHVFIPEIPSRGASASDESLMKPDITASARKAKVLLVEDNLLVAHSLSGVLCDQGFDVVFAEKGERAWELLNEEGAAFGVVLSDLNLPGMTGRDLLQKLHERSNRIPFIILSGHVGSADANELTALGAVGIISKPVNPHELIDLVTRAAAHSG